MLENMMASYNDVGAHLHRVQYVLSTDTNAKAQLVSQDSTEEGTSFDDTDDFIQTKAIDMEENFNHSDDDLFDNPGSPAAKKDIVQTVPSYWTHPAECICQYCTDIVLFRCNILQFICSAESHIQQNSTAIAEAKVSLVLQNFDLLTNKALHHLRSITTDMEWLNTSKTKAVPSVYQDLLLDMSIHLVTIAVIDNNHILFNEWRTKTEELVNTAVYPWMISHQTSLASLLYLEAAFVATPDEEQEDISLEHTIDKLCMDISRVKLKDQDPKTFKTPYIGRGNIKKAQSESDLSVDGKNSVTADTIKKAESVVDIYNTPIDVDTATPQITNNRVNTKPDSVEPMETTPDTTDEVFITPALPVVKAVPATSNRARSRAMVTKLETDMVKKGKTPARKMRAKGSKPLPTPSIIIPDESPVKSGIPKPSEHKTPARRSSARNTIQTPLTASSRNTIQTPLTASSNRLAMLDILMDSDEDEKSMPKITRGRQQTKPVTTEPSKPVSGRGKGRGRKKASTETVENSQPPVPGRKTILPVPVLATVSDNSPSATRSSPICVIHKPTRNCTVQQSKVITDVYEFCSDKTESLSSKPSRAAKSVKPRRGRPPKKTESIESARPDTNAQPIAIDIYDFPVEDNTEVLSSAKVSKPPTRSTRATKGRGKKNLDIIEVGRFSPKGANKEADIDVVDVEDDDDDLNVPLLIDNTTNEQQSPTEETNDEASALLNSSDTLNQSKETARFGSDSDGDEPQTALKQKEHLKRRRRSGGRDVIDFEIMKNKENVNHPQSTAVPELRTKRSVSVWSDDDGPSKNNISES